MSDDIKPVAWAIFRDGELDWEYDQPFSDEPQSMMDDEESRPLYGGEVIEQLRADAERLTKAHDHQHEMAGLMLREAERQSKENNLLRSNQREMLAQLRYIRMHLYAATVQRSPADDRIIAGHIEQAYLRTNEVIMEMEKTDD